MILLIWAIWSSQTHKSREYNGDCHCLQSTGVAAQWVYSFSYAKWVSSKHLMYNIGPNVNMHLHFCKMGRSYFKYSYTIKNQSQCDKHWQRKNLRSSYHPRFKLHRNWLSKLGPDGLIRVSQGKRWKGKGSLGVLTFNHEYAQVMGPSKFTGQTTHGSLDRKVFASPRSTARARTL